MGMVWWDAGGRPVGGQREAGLLRHGQPSTNHDYRIPVFPRNR
jgi:hypothetical protein